MLKPPAMIPGGVSHCIPVDNRENDQTMLEVRRDSVNVIITHTLHFKSLQVFSDNNTPHSSN